MRRRIADAGGDRQRQRGSGFAWRAVEIGGAFRIPMPCAVRARRAECTRKITVMVRKYRAVDEGAYQ